MIEHSDKFKTITNGGAGNGFTTKEILVEFMKEQKKVNDFVMTQFIDGTNKISKNTTSVFYMKWILGVLFSIMSYLFIR